jgi:hypothetical protein
MHDGAVEIDGSGGDEPGQTTSEDSSAVLDVYDTRPCLRGLSKEDQRSTRLAWLMANNKMSAEVAEGASETDIARAWRRPQVEVRNRRVVNFQSWNDATLALMHQPEVRGDGTFVYVPTVSPYDASLPPVLRRFSRLELMGRLGDEILVDRWLSVLDARLRMVAKEWMQRRLLGRFEDRGVDEPETDGDAAAERHGTYLPASEIGTPRHLRQCCSNAMAALRQLGCQYLLFITFTTDISGDWPEVSSRLAFPSQTKRSAAQDPFDRAALHAEVFEAKVQAFLARLRSGSIFRNLGRPTLRTEQWADATGTMKTRRIYEYPMATAGGGFLICAVEDQDRGLGHIHIAYKPARAPKESWNAKPRPGVHMPWVDELLCARIPDEQVLQQFKMVLPASEARAMLGVCGRDGTPHGKYAYLRDVPDDLKSLGVQITEVDLDVESDEDEEDEAGHPLVDDEAQEAVEDEDDDL